VHYPHEVIVVGVDPARTYGAAWAALAVDFAKQIATVIDWEWYENLGTAGVKERLIMAPLVRYRVHWLCYEVNRDAAVLEDTTIVQALESFGVTVKHHFTDGSRADLRVGPGSLAMYMRSLQLRFPYQTADDRHKTEQLDRFFKNFDRRTIAGGRSRPGQPGHEPDDAVFAVWIPFAKILDAWQNLPTGRLPRLPVPRAVLERHRQAQVEREVSGKGRRRFFGPKAPTPEEIMEAITG
jgi:hypothetical protein